MLGAVSGAPMPDYFSVSHATLVVGERRNEIRLPASVHLDACMQQTFFSWRHAVIVVGEILNALNRDNQRTAQGFIQLGGDAAGALAGAYAPSGVNRGSSQPVSLKSRPRFLARERTMRT
ncbi:MAG: hypothetical protein ACRD2I_26110 [Vicinamibacterales bacterium]